MTTSQESSQFQETNNQGLSSMFSILNPPQVNGLTVSPDYFATLTFWGSEWCSGNSKSPPGCAQYYGGYQANVPPFIQSALENMSKIGVSSRNLLLGLHAQGIDSNTITFWCQQITTNSLGGVMISFINKMDPTLSQQLKTCLNSSPSPPGCKSATVQTGDTCYDIANAQCGDGNDWSTELFQDPSCSNPMTQSSCGSLQVGQASPIMCNVRIKSKFT
eukprot:scaffold7775_cov61-Cyclotella_meneghiniana.AAC.16